MTSPPLTLASSPTQTAPLLQADDVHVTFRAGGKPLYGVAGVSLRVRHGEAVAIVGESGSGKSTLAKALVRLHEPERGRIIFNGRDITHVPERRLANVRREFQMIFQDPYASLDPRMTVRQIVGEPLLAHGQRRGIDERIRQLLNQVGLPASAAERYPRQFSGGQRQRISIARALALKPRMLIADEPVSALDVSIQAQIVNLLEDIKQETGVAMILISHDLALVHHVSDKIVVMYLGKVVEQGNTHDTVATPLHPYTAALLSAVPTGRPRKRILLHGDPPSPTSRPAGCAFHPRCPIARNRCADEEPPLQQVSPRRMVACHFRGEIPPPVTMEGESVHTISTPPGNRRS